MYSECLPRPFPCMCTKVVAAYGVVTESSKQQTRTPTCKYIYLPLRIRPRDIRWFRYYLVVTRYVLGWKSTLHVQGEGGPVAIEMTKSIGVAPPSKIHIINLSDNWTTQLRQDGSLSTFRGPDGHQYCWKWSNTFSLGGDLQVNACCCITENILAY